MTSKQLLLTISFSLACLVALGCFIAVFLSTRAKSSGSVEAGKLTHLENYYGYVVTGLVVVLVLLTIADTPWGKATPVNAQPVSVVGQQFAWNIQPSTVRAGVPIKFTLHSLDVAHGFGVYEGDKLIFQVQVPPAGENWQTAYLTLPKPGTYTINCLEFCGWHHHLMIATLRAN